MGPNGLGLAHAVGTPPAAEAEIDQMQVAHQTLAGLTTKLEAFRKLPPFSPTTNLSEQDIETLCQLSNIAALGTTLQKVRKSSLESLLLTLKFLIKEGTQNPLARNLGAPLKEALCLLSAPVQSRFIDLNTKEITDVFIKFEQYNKAIAQPDARRDLCRFCQENGIEGIDDKSITEFSTNAVSLKLKSLVRDMSRKVSPLLSTQNKHLITLSGDNYSMDTAESMAKTQNELSRLTDKLIGLTRYTQLFTSLTFTPEFLTQYVKPYLLALGAVYANTIVNDNICLLMPYEFPLDPELKNYQQHLEALTTDLQQKLLQQRTETSTTLFEEATKSTAKILICFTISKQIFENSVRLIGLVSVALKNILVEIHRDLTRLETTKPILSRLKSNLPLNPEFAATHYQLDQLLAFQQSAPTNAENQDSEPADYLRSLGIYNEDQALADQITSAHQKTSDELAQLRIQKESNEQVLNNLKITLPAKQKELVQLKSLEAFPTSIPLQIAAKAIQEEIDALNLRQKELSDQLENFPQEEEKLDQQIAALSSFIKHVNEGEDNEPLRRLLNDILSSLTIIIEELMQKPQDKPAVTTSQPLDARESPSQLGFNANSQFPEMRPSSVTLTSSTSTNTLQRSFVPPQDHIDLTTSENSKSSSTLIAEQKRKDEDKKFLKEDYKRKKGITPNDAAKKGFKEAINTLYKQECAYVYKYGTKFTEVLRRQCLIYMCENEHKKGTHFITYHNSPQIFNNMVQDDTFKDVRKELKQIIKNYTMNKMQKVTTSADDIFKDYPTEKMPGITKADFAHKAYQAENALNNFAFKHYYWHGHKITDSLRKACIWHKCNDPALNFGKKEGGIPNVFQRVLSVTASEQVKAEIKELEKHLKSS
jgi:hypothetical protein